MTSAASRALVIAVLLAPLVAAAEAEEIAARRYVIHQKGALLLDVPATWRVSHKSLTDPPAVVMRMSPAAGDSFNVQITSVWIDPAKGGPLSADNERSKVQELAAKLLPRSKEKQAEIVELKGNQTRGHYFSLTDRAPAAGEYPCITQGTAVTGEILTIFTILYRDPADPEPKRALRMLAGAGFDRGAPSAAAPTPDRLQIAENSRAYVLTVQVSRLVMTVPKEEFQLIVNPLLTGGNHPRYFAFNGTGGLTISGWFEPQQGFSSLEKLWESETAEWRRKGLPSPQDVSFSKIGGWQVVVYDMPAPAGGTNSHIRAHWLQAGTWIDVHISAGSRETSAELRARLLKILASIEVRERA